MAFVEDLTVFFNTAEFAISTTLAGVAVQGIFDNSYVQGDVGGAGMASSQPTLTLPTASVPPRVIDWFRYFNEPFDPVDLRMAINGTVYQIVAHEPDGQGVSILVLEKVAA
jgi:hypothetical protein